MRKLTIIAALLLTAACTEDWQTAGLEPPVSLTASELLLWEDMTNEERLRAMQFIENGGTLIGSLSPD